MHEIIPTMQKVYFISVFDFYVPGELKLYEETHICYIVNDRMVNPILPQNGVKNPVLILL